MKRIIDATIERDQKGYIKARRLKLLRKYLFGQPVANSNSFNFLNNNKIKLISVGFSL